MILHCVIDACHSGSMLDLEFRAEFDTGAGYPAWHNEYGQYPPRRYKVSCLANSLFRFEVLRRLATAFLSCAWIV